MTTETLTPTASAISALYDRARALAREGYGWEDLHARLGKEGLTRQAARVIVLGKKGS